MRIYEIFKNTDTMRIHIVNHLKIFYYAYKVNRKIFLLKLIIIIIRAQKIGPEAFSSQTRQTLWFTCILYSSQFICDCAGIRALMHSGWLTCINPLFLAAEVRIRSPQSIRLRLSMVRCEKARTRLYTTFCSTLKVKTGNIFQVDFQPIFESIC